MTISSALERVTNYEEMHEAFMEKVDETQEEHPNLSVSEAMSRVAKKHPALYQAQKALAKTHKGPEPQEEEREQSAFMDKVDEVQKANPDLSAKDAVKRAKAEHPGLWDEHRRVDTP